MALPSASAAPIFDVRSESPGSRTIRTSASEMPASSVSAISGFSPLHLIEAVLYDYIHLRRAMKGAIVTAEDTLPEKFYPFLGVGREFHALTELGIVDLSKEYRPLRLASGQRKKLDIRLEPDRNVNEGSCPPSEAEPWPPGREHHGKSSITLNHRLIDPSNLKTLEYCPRFG
jgi:hypothetical protein